MSRAHVFAVALAALSALAPFHGLAGAATITVRRGGDLQAALDRAQPGDEIRLEPGATFTGHFVLPGKPGASFIVVRSAAPDAALPAAGSRITPAAEPLVPRIVSPDSEPALRTAPGAHHWRLLAVELGPNGGGDGDIVRLGDGSPAQASLEVVPHDLVLERCLILGGPTAPQKRGVALNSASTEIRDSWIAGIKAVGQDSQAIAGWNGPGPFTIVNNHLEAAGENFLLGGADPAIEGLVPSHVVFRGNHVSKPPAWRGSAWQVKNLFELKNARDVVVEANLFEYCWEAAQPGYAVLLTPRNQDGRAPWSGVEDVTFQLNVVRHVSGGVSIAGRDAPNQSRQTRGIRIEGNLFYDVSGAAWGGSGHWMLIGDAPKDIVVDHNTVSQTGNIIESYGGTPARPAPILGFVFRNNIVAHNQYGVHGADHGVGKDTLAAYFPGGVFLRNLLAGADKAQYPRDNYFPSGEVGDLVLDASAGDFRLRHNSSYTSAATDGTPVGADAAALGAIVTAVIAGTSPAGLGANAASR